MYWRNRAFFFRVKYGPWQPLLKVRFHRYWQGERRIWQITIRTRLFR